jgi:hypothetical protein
MIDLPQSLWLPPEKPAIIRPADKASFLPGHFPVAAAAAEWLRTLSLFVSAISTTHEIIMPAGVQAGDLIVIFKSGFGLGAPATVTPSGFTNIFNVTNSFGRFTAWHKIAVGAEAGTTLTLDNGLSDRIALGVFRGNRPIASVSVQDIEAVTTAADPAAQTITSSAGIPPLIVCGGEMDSFSPAPNGTIAADTFTFSYKIYNVGDTPADVTIDRGDAGDENDLGGFYINCSDV